MEVTNDGSVLSGARAAHRNAGWRGRLGLVAVRVALVLFFVPFQALLQQGQLLADSTPVRIQTKGAIGTYTNTLAVTFDSPTTSGNQLVVALVDYYPNDGVPFSISDSRGNTWKTAVDYVNGAHIVVLYAENIAGGADTVTVTASSPTYFGMTAVEYTGLASANSLDVVASNRATGASYTSTVVTLASGNELLFGVHRVGGSTVTFTPTSPWSTVATQINYDETQVQDRVVAAAGTYASTGTESTPNDTMSVLVAFRGGWTGGLPAISSFTASPSTILGGNRDRKSTRLNSSH